MRREAQVARPIKKGVGERKEVRTRKSLRRSDFFTGKFLQRKNPGAKENAQATEKEPCRKSANLAGRPIV